MDPQTLIIHERLATWARRLRPRFRGDAIRWAETRSTASLAEAVAASSCPILVVDLADRPARMLEDIGAALAVAPTALSLALDPSDRPEIALLSRELGATLVLSGLIVPPEIEAILRRWLPLARGRAEAAGWSRPNEPKPDFLTPALADLRPA